MLLNNVRVSPNKVTAILRALNDISLTQCFPPYAHCTMYIPSLMILTLFTTLNIMGPGETIEKMRSERTARVVSVITIPRNYA